MRKRLSLEQAQQKIDKIYGENNFKLLEYISYGKPCKIQCKTCQKIFSFSQFGNVISKKMVICKKCHNYKQDYFLQSLNDIFPDEPIEILSFSSNNGPITIKCLKCGHITSVQRANNLKHREHLCSKCFPPRYKDIEKTINNFKNFISKSDKWELLDKDIDNIHTGDKIACRCKLCGEINYKTIHTYLKGVGCGKCYGHLLKTKEDFQKEIGNEYQLIGEYRGSKQKVLLKHTCGFIFKIYPDSFFNGTRCPKCHRKQSKGEREISRILKKYNIDFEQEFPITIEKRRLRFDFYLPSIQKFIEYQGIQHYEPFHFNEGIDSFKRQQENDAIKEKWAKDNLLKISYKDFNNIEKILTDWLLL